MALHSAAVLADAAEKTNGVRAGNSTAVLTDGVTAAPAAPGMVGGGGNRVGAGAMAKDVAVGGILRLLTLYVQQSHIRGLTTEEQTHFEQLNAVRFCFWSCVLCLLWCVS